MSDFEFEFRFVSIYRILAGILFAASLIHVGWIVWFDFVKSRPKIFAKAIFILSLLSSLTFLFFCTSNWMGHKCIPPPYWTTAGLTYQKWIIIVYNVLIGSQLILFVNIVYYRSRPFAKHGKLLGVARLLISAIFLFSMVNGSVQSFIEVPYEFLKPQNGYLVASLLSLVFDIYYLYQFVRYMRSRDASHSGKVDFNAIAKYGAICNAFAIAAFIAAAFPAIFSLYETVYVGLSELTISFFSWLICLALTVMKCKLEVKPEVKPTITPRETNATKSNFRNMPLHLSDFQTSKTIQ